VTAWSGWETAAFWCVFAGACMFAMLGFVGLMRALNHLVSKLGGGR